MTTTELFVEILIIGFGALIWLFLFLVSIVGHSWLTQASTLSSWFSLGLTLAVTYVFGIIIDRLADFLFGKWDKKLRFTVFQDGPGVYQEARTVIYGTSESLRNWFQYGRSRLRICRGWSINCLLCIISLNLFIWIRLPSSAPRLPLSIFGSFVFLFILLGAIRVWHSLTKAEYRRLYEEFIFLEKTQAKSQ